MWSLLLAALTATTLAAPAPVPAVNPWELSPLNTTTTAVTPACVGIPILGIPCSKKLVKNHYVAFGDSFAAGLGAGKEEGGQCFRGNHSYAQMLTAVVTDKHTQLQDLTCTDTNITKQIQAWKEPGKTDLATLTMGSVQAKLFDIINHCVIQANVETDSEKDCEDAWKKSIVFANNTKFVHHFNQTIEKIYAKGSAGNANFRLLVTGYARPFHWQLSNVSKEAWTAIADQNPCENTTYSIFDPLRAKTKDDADKAFPWLTRTTQDRVNSVFEALNKLIEQSVTAWQDRKDNTGKANVQFVPIDTAFNDHTMCRVGQDVNPANTGTFFFLSGFEEHQKNSTTKSTDAITNPPKDDKLSCAEKKHSWPHSLLCALKKGNDKTDSLAHKTLTADQKAVTEKKLDDVKVPYWMTVREAKTFHWKTGGHLLVMKALVEAWEKFA